MNLQLCQLSSQFQFKFNQPQRPRVLGCDSVGIAKKSYPASEVRGSGQEEPSSF